MNRTTDFDTMLISMVARIVRSCAMLQLGEYKLTIVVGDEYDVINLEKESGENLIGFQFASAPDVLTTDDEIYAGIMSIKDNIAAMAS